MTREQELEREVAFLRELVKSQNAMLERLLTQPPQFVPLPYAVPANPCPCPEPSPYPVWPNSPSPLVPIFPSYPEIICADASSTDPLARMAADFYATHDVRWSADQHGTAQ